MRSDRMTRKTAANLLEGLLAFDVARARHVLEEFQSFQPKLDRILDVGCGDGAFFVRGIKAAQAGEVYGSNTNDPNLALAEKERN